MPNNQWIIFRQGQQAIGPMSSKEIKTQIDKGLLSQSDEAVKADEPNGQRKKLLELKELFMEEEKTEVLKTEILKTEVLKTEVLAQTKTQQLQTQIIPPPSSSPSKPSSPAPRSIETSPRIPAGVAANRSRSRSSQISKNHHTKDRNWLTIILIFMVILAGVWLGLTFKKRLLQTLNPQQASEPVIIANSTGKGLNPKDLAIPIRSDSRNTPAPTSSKSEPAVGFSGIDALTKEPVTLPAHTSPPAALQKNSFNLIASLKASNGQSVTLGPLFFAPSDLEGCQTKCVLAMFDAQGGSIQVKFFKAAYEDKLKEKSPSLYVTGQIQDNGLSLILSRLD